MTPEVSASIVGASSALLGSVIGGLITFMTTKHTTAIQWRQGQLDKQIDRLVALHSDFLAENQ